MRRAIQIRGQRWYLSISRPPINGCDGLCCYDEKTIYVRPNSGDKRGATIHEILHASLPDIEEEAICEIEEAICKGLDLLGQS